MERDGDGIAEKIAAAFDERRQRKTRPRRLIVERLGELAASGEDFTIEDLWQELRQREPGLDGDHSTHTYACYHPVGGGTPSRAVEVEAIAG